MVKKNKLLVGCLSLLLVLSVGYALFSETITINGTATAKGNFDINVSCITDVTPDLFYELGFEDYSKDGDITTVAEMYRSHGYKDELCTVNGDTVTYSVGLEYPTATKYSFIKMINNGTIPAYFDFENVVSQHSNNTIKKYDEQNNLLETINEDEIPFFMLLVGEMSGKTSQGQYYYSVEDEEDFIINFADINEETGEIKIILKPGETLYMPLIAKWIDLIQYNENNIKYEATGTVKIDWIQYTE